MWLTWLDQWAKMRPPCIRVLYTLWGRPMENKTIELTIRLWNSKNWPEGFCRAHKIRDAASKLKTTDRTGNLLAFSVSKKINSHCRILAENCRSIDCQFHFGFSEKCYFMFGFGSESLKMFGSIWLTVDSSTRNHPGLPTACYILLITCDFHITFFAEQLEQRNIPS